MRKVMANVAGPQLFQSWFSQAGEGSDAEGPGSTSFTLSSVGIAVERGSSSGASCGGAGVPGVTLTPAASPEAGVGSTSPG